MISTTFERIRGGRWFQDGNLRNPRRMFKFADRFASGLPCGLIGVNLSNGRLTNNFNVNAVDDKGTMCCCPYGMEIFYVESVDDLLPEGETGFTYRHIEKLVNRNGETLSV